MSIRNDFQAPVNQMTPLLDSKGMDPLSEQREKITRFIQSNYTVFATNVKHVWDAQVICLGNTHTMPQHRQNNAQIVNMLYQPGDVLLVEGLKDEPISEEYRDEKYRQVTSSVEIRGWDIYNVTDLTKEEILYQKARKIAIDPWYLVEHRIEEKIMDRHASYYSLTIRPWVDAIFTCICRPCIQKYYKRQVDRYIQSEIIDQHPNRNRSMCQCIDQTIEKSNKKVFVMAGEAHFATIDINDKEVQEEIRMGVDVEPYYRAMKETHEYLQTRKFIILIPIPAEESEEISRNFYQYPGTTSKS